MPDLADAPAALSALADVGKGVLAVFVLLGAAAALVAILARLVAVLGSLVAVLRSFVELFVELYHVVQLNQVEIDRARRKGDRKRDGPSPESCG